MHVEELSNFGNRDPAQVVDKRLAVSIVEKNILASIPACHHMVGSAFKLDSKRAGHGPILAGEVGLMHVTRPPWSRWIPGNVGARIPACHPGSPGVIRACDENDF